ncbi:MAG TPA: PhzF family phenazine biosynthesis protein [Ktedonobacteraceae bacterium]|jgi:PhzF family phenazine biosynthesis protein
MSTHIVQVDAFTNTPFAGNPAAVCVLSEEHDEQWMQYVAREMNLSETAFLVRKEDGFQLRWFTPAVEVDLCGHATLASAHVLWEGGLLLPEAQARFFTRSGLLTATRRDDGWIEMDFPAAVEEPAPAPAGLLEALGVSAMYVGKNRFDYLIEVESESVVREIQPNLSLLASVPTRGVMVTSWAGKAEYDFVSRFFGPRVGVNEDPVTGSAHCCLGPYWGRKLGRDELVGYQASARGGTVRVRLADARVILAGQAVTVLRGELL